MFLIGSQLFMAMVFNLASAWSISGKNILYDVIYTFYRLVCLHVAIIQIHQLVRKNLILRLRSGFTKLNVKQ